MTRDFDPHDVSTWSVTLTLQQVAAIYQRSAETIRHSLKPSSTRVRFSPAPFKRQPLRWRRVDVERDVCGGRSTTSTSSRTRTAAASASRVRGDHATTAATHASEG